MSFSAIAGQEQVKRMLIHVLKQDRLSHAYIFSGPEGTGRRQMAWALAKALFCRNFADDVCGQCVECRRVEHGNHPGVHWLEPEGASVKIEQIRELQKRFSYRAAGREKKMYIVNEAEKMTVQAANSLLKFFEEPGAQVVAVLITENGHALLPTIRSRAQWVSFSPLPPQTIFRQLIEEGCSPTLAAPAAHLSAGLGKARKLVQDPMFAEMRNIVIQLAKESLLSFPASLLTAQQKVFKSAMAERMPLMMDLFILWYKDLIRIQSGRKETLIFSDQEEWMTRHAFARPLSFWIGCVEQAMELKKRLRLHVNAQLALERFFVGQGGG